MSKINSCIFYDKYLIDDLKSYNLSYDIFHLYITYEDGVRASVDFSKVSDFLEKAVEDIRRAKEKLKPECWYPIFIDANTNNVNLKTILKGSVAQYDNFGIEKAISFVSNFKSWNISNDPKMCIDWFINALIPSHYTQYGILAWVKESDFSATPAGWSNKNIPKSSIVMPVEDLTYKTDDGSNSRTISVTTNDKLRKIDNNKFEILINQSIIKNQIQENDTNIFTFNNQDNIFEINKYVYYKYPQKTNEKDDDYAERIKKAKQDVLFYLYDINKLKPDPPQPQIIRFANNNNKKYTLYISNGDVYSYFESEQEAATLQPTGVPSLTYLSPSLFHHYREIWHALTIYRTKGDFLSKNSYRLLKKVCQFLSTFPLIDKTTINILYNKSIHDIVNNFISKTFRTSTEESRALFDVLVDISSKFVDLSANILESNNQYSNYIIDPIGLFKKLVSKYGAYLNLDNTKELVYKKKLKYGPHVKINQDTISKTHKSKNNIVIYNNIAITVGSFVAKSLIDSNTTIFSVFDANNRSRPGAAGQGSWSPTTIPLWDIEKKKLLSTELNITAGKDFIITYTNNNQELRYSLENTDLGDIDKQIILGEKVDILWTRISGPDCLRFSDANLSLIRSEGGIDGPNAPKLATPDSASTTIINNGSPLAGSATPPVSELVDTRYETSTETRPTLFIRKTGKYILRLRAKTSFGIVYDTVTIYVVDNNGEYEKGKKPTTLQPATIVTLKPYNGLVVICPNLRECAIGKQGVFWPIYSDLSVYTKEYNPVGAVEPFGGNIKKYSFELLKDTQGNKIIINDPVDLKIRYEPNNTEIQIRRIVLSHMRDKFDDCKNCQTFFQNILDNKGFVVDINRDFYLTDIGSIDPDTRTYKEFKFSYPSEASAYGIDSYGGLYRGLMNSTVQNLLWYSFGWFSYDDKETLDTLNGIDINHLLDDGSPAYLCHMKPLDKSEHERYHEFFKGTFIRNSGWIFNKNKDLNLELKQYSADLASLDKLNKSSVTNMAPEHRNTFKFKGQGFFNLNNTNADSDTDPQVYFSSITVGIDDIAKECKYGGGDAGIASSALECTVSDLQETEKKEISDIDPNYGYRNVSGDFDEIKIINSDEFKINYSVDPDGATTSNSYCSASASQNYNVDYLFTKKGRYLPQNQRNSTSRFDKKIATAKIEDLEVQINFINYVNTKNLIIWLDVLPCEWIRKRLYPRYGDNFEMLSTLNTRSEPGDRWVRTQKPASNSKYSNKYMETKNEIDSLPDSELKKYLQALFEMNNNPKPEFTSDGLGAPGSISSFNGDFTQNIDADGHKYPWSPTFRLYLLNQEHIEGNKYNFSLRFSDHADKKTYSHNANYINIVDPQQIKAIEQNGVIHLLPTVSATGYSDSQIAFFRQIIDTNQLNTLNNQFAKFNGMELFFDGDGKPTWGSTKFTLGIAVINESDNMELLDSTIGSEFITAIERTEKYNRSNFLINNICNWELILHTKSPEFEPGGVLGNIQYHSEEDWPGYSFMCEVAPQEDIPPINLNAPYDYIQDAGICRYNKEKLNIPVQSYTPFNILPLILIQPQATLVGNLNEIISINSQLEELGRQIYDYFKNERRLNQYGSYFNSLYVPKYDKYPMGESDKALLSISKDGLSWYQLEASMFRYDNCLIANNTKRFRYSKLNYENNKALSIFNFKRPTSLRDFFNNNRIKTVSIPLRSIDDLKNLTLDNLIQKYNEIKMNIERYTKKIEELKTQSMDTSQAEKTLAALSKGLELYKQTINNIGDGINIYDPILVIKTVTGNETIKNQEGKEEIREIGYNLDIAGSYILSSDGSVLKLDQSGELTFDKIMYNLLQNNLLDIKINIGQVVNSDNKVAQLYFKNNFIIIEGLRAFYFFDKNDEITIIQSAQDYIKKLRADGNEKAAQNKETKINNKKEELKKAKADKLDETRIRKIESELWKLENITSINKVLHKGYVYNGENYTTILELEKPFDGTSISKSPDQSDVAIVYDADYFTQEQNQITKFNRWGWIDKRDNNYLLLSDRTPTKMNSLFGEGSYGTGSSLVNPNTLSNKQVPHRIPSTIDQLGINSDSHRLIELKFPDSSLSKAMESIYSVTERVKGYYYTHKDNLYTEEKVNFIEINNNVDSPLKLSNLFKYQPIYTKLTDNFGIMDMHASVFKGDRIKENEGWVSINILHDFSYPINSFTKADCDKFNARLSYLQSKSLLLNKLDSELKNCAKTEEEIEQCRDKFWNSIKIEELSIEDIIIYLDKTRNLDIEDKQSKQKEAAARKNQLLQELSDIIYYAELGGLTKTNVSIVTNNGKEDRIQLEYTKSEPIPKPMPVIDIAYSSRKDESLMFYENKIANNYYWINIDPEQSITLDYSNTKKILTQVEYTCQLVNDQYSQNMNDVCPTSLINPESDSPGTISGDEKFSQNGNVFTYTMPIGTILEEMERLGGEWPEPINDSFSVYNTYVVERNFFLNALNKERNQLIKSKEIYILPKISSDKNGIPDGDVKNKVKDIFNLDDVNTLQVNFKNIPRKWKGVDNKYEVYKPNAIGELTKSVISSPGGPIDHTLKFWHCISSVDGKYIDPPLYFKWLNEMIFRAYYGSVDGAEHCGRINSESREPGDWIPYDYM